MVEHRNQALYRLLELSSIVGAARWRRLCFSDVVRLHGGAAGAGRAQARHALLAPRGQHRRAERRDVPRRGAAGSGRRSARRLDQAGRQRRRECMGGPLAAPLSPFPHFTHPSLLTPTTHCHAHPPITIPHTCPPISRHHIHPRPTPTPYSPPYSPPYLPPMPMPIPHTTLTIIICIS